MGRRGLVRNQRQTPHKHQKHDSAEPTRRIGYVHQRIRRHERMKVHLWNGVSLLFTLLVRVKQQSSILSHGLVVRIVLQNKSRTPHSVTDRCCVEIDRIGNAPIVGAAVPTLFQGHHDSGKVLPLLIVHVTGLAVINQTKTSVIELQAVS
jgi:hypothetical protein